MWEKFNLKQLQTPGEGPKAYNPWNTAPKLLCYISSREKKKQYAVEA